MNNSDNEQVVVGVLGAYVEWREECARVRDADRRWATAPLRHVSDAFGDYLAALRNEE
jgi:hypothetical protein